MVRPELLSEGAVGAIVRAALGGGATDELCAAVWAASGGNPLYLTELLRAVELEGRPLAELDPAELLAGGREGVARRVLAGVRGPGSARAAPGAGACRARGRLRAAPRGGDRRRGDVGRHLAGCGLVRLEVLAADDPPRFIHPVVRDAVEASLASDARDALHRSAARLLHADGAPPGQVAAHLVGVRPAGDGWVLARLREAARAAMQSGAPGAAAGLLGRALAEPPPLSSESTSCARPRARRRAPGARRRARSWRRRCGSPPIRGSAPRSRLRSPRRTRRCSGGWTRWM